MRWEISHMLWSTILFGFAQSTSGLKDYEEFCHQNRKGIQGVSRIRLRIPRVEKSGYNLSRRRATAFTKPAVDEVAKHRVPVYTRDGISPGSTYLKLLLGADDQNLTVPIQNMRDSAHLAPITIGGQSFMGLLDTGSADIWMAGNPFKCTRTSRPCSFPASYKETTTFEHITDKKFDIMYSTGERLQGKLGKEVVSFGSVTVKNGTVAIVHEGEFMLDRMASGIIGMAHSGDTMAYAADVDVYGDKLVHTSPYTSVFTEMHQQGLVAPYFSIALQRSGEPSGQLALGGLPTSPIKYEKNFTTARFEYLIFEDGSYGRLGNKVKEYSLYMIKTVGFSIASKTISLAVDAIFDTGSPFNYVPTEIAAAVVKAFKPPGYKDQKSGQFVVNCDATPPPFGININGTTLMVDTEHLIIKGSTKKERVGNLPLVTDKNKCLSAVQESGLFAFGVYIIGTPFLKSHVTVFDIGAAEMRFAKRLR